MLREGAIRGSSAAWERRALNGSSSSELSDMGSDGGVSEGLCQTGSGRKGEGAGKWTEEDGWTGGPRESGEVRRESGGDVEAAW